MINPTTTQAQRNDYHHNAPEPAQDKNASSWRVTWLEDALAHQLKKICRGINR